MPARMGSGLAAVDVATHADGVFAVEAGFALLWEAAGHEDAAAVAEDGVGDDLAVGQVLLRLGAGKPAFVSLDQGENGGDILNNEGALGEGRVQDGGGDDQYVFHGGLRSFLGVFFWLCVIVVVDPGEKVCQEGDQEG